MESKTVEELKKFLKKHKALGYSKLAKKDLIKMAKKVQKGGQEFSNMSNNNLEKEYKKLQNELDEEFGENRPRRTVASIMVNNEKERQKILKKLRRNRMIAELEIHRHKGGSDEYNTMPFNELKKKFDILQEKLNALHGPDRPRRTYAAIQEENEEERRKLENKLQRQYMIAELRHKGGNNKLEEVENLGYNANAEDDRSLRELEEEYKNLRNRFNKMKKEGNIPPQRTIAHMEPKTNKGKRALMEHEMRLMREAMGE